MSYLNLTHRFRAGTAVALAMLAVALALLMPSAGPAVAAAPTAAAPITVNFDHFATGFELDGVHRDLPCEACHLNAVFKGTPRNCGTCHITGSTFNATPKNSTHIMSTNNCAACHNTISFRPDVHFDHAEVMGSCVSCHNGSIAQGEGPNHIKSSNQCDACHTVMSWNPPKAVDHAQIPLSVMGYCIICHNGSIATGQNKGHIKTSLECGDCHVTTNWLGADFNHTGITTGCFSCHNGVKAVGKQGNHMPTSNLCEDCHTTGIGTTLPSWVPSGFDHTQLSTPNTCLPCHNGSQKLVATGADVVGKPANHIPLNSATTDCITCHANTPTAETWTTIAASIPQLHTGLNTSNCTLCHGGETFAGVPAPYIPMNVSGVSPTHTTPLAPPHIPIASGIDCSSCHGRAYTAGGFGPATAMTPGTHAYVSTTCDVCHDTGKAFYTGGGTPLQVRPQNHITSTDPRMATGDCSLCHTVNDWASNTMPAGHMPNPANQACVTCHASAPNDYTPATLAAYSAIHTGIAGNCGQCHGDTTNVLTWFSNYTPKDAILTPAHIPYLSGTDCSSCHSSTTYAAGTFGPMNMTPAKHAFVPTACDTCHGTATGAFTMGTANPSLQLRPLDHNAGQMLTGDCSVCHTPANWISTVLPTGHMPNPANLSCATCHTASSSGDYTVATLAANSVLHTGVAGNCGACHGDTATALTWYQNYTPKDAILTPAHIPYTAGTDCSSCHVSSTYAAGTFGPMNMTQATHAFVPGTCNTCHESGGVGPFTLGAANPALQPRPNDHTIGQMAKPTDCSVCHTTANWLSSWVPAGHMPNPAGTTCNVCHASAPADYTQATLGTITALHTGISGNCAVCHGALGATAPVFTPNYTPKAATGLASPHIPYTSGSDCSGCHVVGANFMGTAMTAATHAFVPTTCDTCHGQTTNVYINNGPVPLQLRPMDHTTSGDAQQQTGDCSMCHNTAGWASNTLPIGHMPNPGAQACATCHTAITASFASYATLTTDMSVMHTGITGNCQQCHGSPAGALTFYNNNDNPVSAVLTPTHIPFLSGTDCSSCHVVGAHFSGTGMTVAKHAFVPTTCDQCHGQSSPTYYYMTGAPVPMQIRPGNHTAGTQATGDCSGCHNTTDWTSIVLPTGHMPNPGNQSCATCHIGAPTAYNTFASIAVIHTGISGNCGLCHGTPSGALSFYNNGDIPNEAPKAAVLSPSHIPYSNGVDCSSCHTTNYTTGGFGPMTMTAATHVFVPTTCDTCHELGMTWTLGNATPNVMTTRPNSGSYDHVHNPSIPDMTTHDCSECHITSTWVTTALPNGHMPNPAGQGCVVCHTQAPTNYTVFATLPIIHTGITTGCAQCHGGATTLTFYNNGDIPNEAPIAAASLSPAHIPAFTGEDCSACHAKNYATHGFGPMNMTQATHAQVGSTCDSCHGVASPTTFYIGAASPGLQIRPTDHTATNMATDDCASCHTTANWLSAVVPTGHMPNPAGTACNTCHTSGPSNFVPLASNVVIHTGITGNCLQCHGVTQLSFYNNNDPPKPQVANHIPYLSGTDCNACHVSTTYASFGPMNMTQATHAFVSTTCDTCHTTQNPAWAMGSANPMLQLRPNDHILAGGQQASGDCSACHTTANWNSTVLPSGHMPNPSNLSCVTCHTTAPSDYTTATLAANSVLHTGIAGNCTQCHGAFTAETWATNFTPKDAILSPAHIPFNSGTDCSSCHSSSTYAVGTFGPMNMTQAKHAFVPTTCNSCHDAVVSGTFTMGSANPQLQVRPMDHKSADQVTPNDCGKCHTTADWVSNTLPAGHMPNPAALACATCHVGAPADYTTLAVNSVLHTGITGNCAQCHGGTTALTWYNNFTPKDAVLSPPHIPYTSGTDCGACHKSSTYAAGTFGPMNMTQATHAYVTTACDTCHGTATGSFSMGAANPGLQLRPNDHKTGTMLTGDCGGCHTTADWTSNSLPAGHMPNPSNLACATCHIGSPTTYTTFASNAVIHTGIAANCGQCHGTSSGALTFYNNGDIPAEAPIAAAGLSPAHLPYLSGTDCGSCHKSTTYATGTFGPMNMTQATHAFVSTTCDGCHGTPAAAIYMSQANNPVLQLRPGTHVMAGGQQATGDCSGCHTTANWNSTSLPANHMPNPANQACITCHTKSPSDYTTTTLATYPIIHTGITTSCITCHAGPAQAPPVYAISFTPKNAATMPSGVHIPSLTAACEGCHTSTGYNTGGFAGTSMSSAKHTAFLALNGNDCLSCHESGRAFYGVNNLTTRPNGHHTGQNCAGSNCHNTSSFGGGAAKKTAATAPTAAKSTVGTVVSAAATTRLGRVVLPGELGVSGRALGTGSLTASTMTHVGVTTNCANCHNGVLATGKSATHVASNNACENCHTTVAWIPARFDHQGVTATCVSCHNGATAPGKPTNHIATAEDCARCHGTIAWLPVVFSHVGITATCASCHNGITATAKQVGHVATTADCSTCHTTLNWTPKTVPASVKPATPKRKSTTVPSLHGAANGQTP